MAMGDVFSEAVDDVQKARRIYGADYQDELDEVVLVVMELGRLLHDLGGEPSESAVAKREQVRQALRRVREDLGPLYEETRTSLVELERDHQMLEQQ